MSKPAPASKPARPAPAAPSPAAESDAPAVLAPEAPEADTLRAEVNALRERIAVLEAEPRIVDVDAVDLGTVEPVSSDATTLLALCAAVNLGSADNVRAAALRLAARLASQVAP